MSLEKISKSMPDPSSREEKNIWNAKDKKCTRGCDDKHICVVCVCDNCGTADLETMKCNCAKEEIPEWKQREAKKYLFEIKFDRFDMLISLLVGLFVGLNWITALWFLMAVDIIKFIYFLD